MNIPRSGAQHMRLVSLGLVYLSVLAVLIVEVREKIRIVLTSPIC